MKKNKNQELSENFLNNEELSTLKGGYIAATNKNKFSGCNCDYKDKCSVLNYNTVRGCNCTCI